MADDPQRARSSRPARGEPRRPRRGPRPPLDEALPHLRGEPGAVVDGAAVARLLRLRRRLPDPQPARVTAVGAVAPHGVRRRTAARTAGCRSGAGRVRGRRGAARALLLLRLPAGHAGDARARRDGRGAGILVRLGLAVFFAMNVMMLSLPTYVPSCTATRRRPTARCSLVLRVLAPCSRRRCWRCSAGRSSPRALAAGSAPAPPAPTR